MINTRVQIYFNIRKKCFSVRDKKTRRVIAHVNNICLEDVVFKVSKAGRKRVLREQRKNVHAWVEGTVTNELKSELWDSQATYNPYKYDSFINVETKQRLSNCDKVYMGLVGKKPVTFFK